MRERWSERREVPAGKGLSLLGPRERTREGKPLERLFPVGTPRILLATGTGVGKGTRWSWYKTVSNRFPSCVPFPSAWESEGEGREPAAPTAPRPGRERSGIGERNPRSPSALCIPFAVSRLSGEQRPPSPASGWKRRLQEPECDLHLAKWYRWGKVGIWGDASAHSSAAQEDQMAAAASPVTALAFPFSPTSLLLSRSRSPTPAAFSSDLTSSLVSYMRRRLVLRVGALAAAALAASVPPAVLQDSVATLLITAGAYSLVRVFDALTERRLIKQVSCFASISRYACLADIVGRRYGSLKLPFNKKKSWIGSITMFISGFLLSVLMLFYFSCLGYIRVNWEMALAKLVLVALAATVVECIPVTDVVDDNISVPLATMLVAFLLFGSLHTSDQNQYRKKDS